MHQAYSALAPNFKGTATLKKYQVQGEQLIQIAELTSPNIINKRSIELLLLSNQAVFTTGRKIAISTDTYTPNFERTTVGNVIAIGNDSLSGVTGYNFAEKTETTPRAVTYHNRFPTPSAVRSFQTIAIVDGSTNNNTANISANAYAYLSFASPVEQATNEIIDIFYKVYLEWTSSPINLGSTFQAHLEYLFLGQGASLQYGINNLCEEIISIDNPDRDLRWKAVDNNEKVSQFSANQTQRSALLKREFTATVSFLQNRHYFGVTYGRLEPNSTNPIRYGFKGTAGFIPFAMPSSLGNVFSHADTGTLFYDGNALANSSWKPAIDDLENRTDDLPCIYTLKVESSGGVGIGTYSLYKTIFSGHRYNNENWGQDPSPLVTTSKYPYFVPEDDDIPFSAKWVYPWLNDTQWVSANETTVAIWQIYPSFEVLQSWNLGTISINDLASNPNTNHIYVATEQGLYDLDVAGNTATLLDPDPCKAVDVAYNDEVFAVFSNRLASSLNASWSDAHGFSGAINWNNVIFIRVDRASADYNLAILEFRYNPRGGIVNASLYNSWFAKIHWWNNTNNYVSTIECQQLGSSSAGYWHKSIIFPHNSSFVVRDGLWVYPKYIRNAGGAYARNPRTWNRDRVKALAQSGTNIVNGDGSVDDTYRQFMKAFDVGIAKFNQQLRNSNFDGTSSDSETLKSPTFIILDTDVASGWISVCMGDYYGGTGNSGSTDRVPVQNTAGCYDLAVSETDSTVSDIRGYKNTGLNSFRFTDAGYGQGSRPLYYLAGNAQVSQTGGIISFTDPSITSQGVTNWGSSYAGHPKGILGLNTYYHPIMISVWGGYNRSWQERPSWSTRYGWNDTTSEWEKDPDNLLPGKPLDPAQEDLVDGLAISWSDLNPAETRDLVAGQSYTFTRVPGDTGFVSDGTYASVPIKYSYYLRPVVLYDLNTTISAATLTLDPVTSDPLWLSLDPYAPEVIELNIDGYAVPATTILSGTPGVNEVKVSDSVGGILEFNAADVGKTVTGEVLYMRKIHTTEVL